MQRKTTELSAGNKLLKVQLEATLRQARFKDADSNGHVTKLEFIGLLHLIYNITNLKERDLNAEVKRNPLDSPKALRFGCSKRKGRDLNSIGRDLHALTPTSSVLHLFVTLERVATPYAAITSDRGQNVIWGHNILCPSF
ncbi:uncharacterized protein G2W53_026605 [Senna tora]|uniref:EF-hand domain-containing protein n=1 Tax=Senna tora TaxID=362788 RepID=A0A834WF86_9FABA|nr:uncharacterized protein G2W53_026605 [Senna tora]